MRVRFRCAPVTGPVATAIHSLENGLSITAFAEPDTLLFGHVRT